MAAPGALGARGGLGRALGPFLPAAVLLLAIAIRAAADAEVFPGYHRPARDEAPSSRWPEPEPGLQNEDELVERVNALRHDHAAEAGDLEDLAAQRQRLSALRERQEQQQQQTDAQTPPQEVPLPVQRFVWPGLAPGLASGLADSQGASTKTPEPLQDPEAKAKLTPEAAPRPKAGKPPQAAAQAKAPPQPVAPVQADRPQDAPDALKRDETQRDEADEADEVDAADAGNLDELALTLLRALAQEPRVENIDSALVRSYLGSEFDGILSALLLQQLQQQQQQQQPVVDPVAAALKDAMKPSSAAATLRQAAHEAAALQRHRDMHRKAQRQQRKQERHQQLLLDDQRDQLDAETARSFGVEPRQQEPFTFQFNDRQAGAQRFASSPADPRFYEPDARLGLFSRGSASQVQQARAAHDEPFDEGALGGALADAVPVPLSSEQLSGQLDDILDENEDDDFARVRSILAPGPVPPQLYDRQRVTPPVEPVRQARPGGRDAAQDVARDRPDRTVNHTHEYPVVKKQLTFPKDHWFFGMDDVGKLAIVIGCSIAVSSLILGFIVWQYRLHRNAKAAADVEYPAYGVTGPNKDISPTGDRRLAQSAQMYHYQHQKQQILAMENRAAGGRRGSMSEAESEDENEEGDYTVYECPGLAPTQEMEVKNPLFQDDPTPATPAPGMGAEAGSDTDGLPEGGSHSSSHSSRAAPPSPASRKASQDKAADSKQTGNGRPPKP